MHNGIIENFQELKDELVAEGRRFDSDTDTEVVAQLLTSMLEQQMTPEEAMGAAMDRLRGAFALVALFSGRHDILLGARRGSSLAIGYGDGEMYVGSDALALAPFTKRVSYLEDDDWVVLQADGCKVYQGTTEVTREIRQSGISGAMIGKGNHRHFMLKEIHEQPAVIGDTLHSYLDPATRRSRCRRCRSTGPRSAALTMTGLRHRLLRRPGREVLVRAAGAPAGRGRGRLGVPLPRAAAAGGRRLLAVSQSGETVDTLAAIRYAKANGQTHPVGGQRAGERDRPRIARRAADPGRARDRRRLDQGLHHPAHRAADRRDRRRPGARHAERGRRGRARPRADRAAGARSTRRSTWRSDYRRISEEILAEARDVLYLGRGTSFPIALEGALKLKEISYIHAEGYAAGEMKHGPIALIDELVPVVVVAPTRRAVRQDRVELRAGQGARRQAGADQRRRRAWRGSAARPPPRSPCRTVDPVVAPILYTVPVQLLAYHTAVAKGTDVDQPRNLAKSVTVE